MVRKSFMLIAGETSGDLLGAELVRSLREKLAAREAVPTDDWQPLDTTLEPEFFGAGGPHMAAAGVNLALDLTEHAVVGLWEVVKKYGEFRRLLGQLVQLAIDRQPQVIVCIDFSGFNLRLAHAIRSHVRGLRGTFANWSPHMVQYVSPQVWASRPNRARSLARDCDLLLSIFPFEKEWYAQRVPGLRVEFVGHPLADRYGTWCPDLMAPGGSKEKTVGYPPREGVGPEVLLLPGSRTSEIQRHLPVMLEALKAMRSAKPTLRARMILPNDGLFDRARAFPLPLDLQVQIRGLAAALAMADVAIASTGTVTLECAYFGVPTVALYKTSWASYQIGKRLIHVKYLAMPNLLADQEILPEFIQDAAQPDRIARAALELLDSPERRDAIRSKLASVSAALGPPGASDRAAEAILRLVEKEPRPIRACLGP